MPKILNRLLILFTFSFIFMLTGCSFTEENLENYYYIMAIGIDSSKDASSKIDLSVQIASNSEESSSGQGSSQSNSSNIYTVSCNSIDSGISILNNYLSKKLNLSHCSAIIFSEELSQKGIKDYVNALGNNPEIRPTCNIIISNKSSLEALEKISNSNEQFSSKFYEFIESSTKYTGYSITAELSEFFYCLNFGENSAVATYATVSDKTLQNTGIAIFNQDKFIGNLCVLDAISYSLITNRLNSATITIKNPKNADELIDVSIKQLSSPTIKCNLINNYPYITINIPMEYDILSSTYNINATTSLSENALLETSINNYLEEMITKFLYEISHKYNVDICNFKNKTLNNFLTLDDFNKIHWNEIYKDSYFNVNINGTIKNLGIF